MKSLLLSLTLATPVLADDPQPVCIVGATLLDVEAGELLPYRTVICRGDRIETVGRDDDVDVPEDALVVDANGTFLLPGLAEMHGHLPYPQQGRAFAEDVMFLYVANGITTVRGMLGDPQQLELAAEVERGELVGPRLIVGSPPLHGGATPTVEAALAQVEAHVKAGYAHLKVHEGLAPEVYAAICEAAEAKGIRWGGHVSDFVGLDAALEAGQATVDHLDNVLEWTVADDVRANFAAGFPPHVLADATDPDRFPELAKKFVAHDVAVVPSMALWATIFGGKGANELRAERDECRYMPQATVAGWKQSVDQYAMGIPKAAGAAILEHRRTALKTLHEAGVRVLLGTDSPQMYSVPGFSMKHEVLEMQAAGMSPLDILRSGTSNVHAYYEDDAPFGIVPGAAADLVLVRDDPLEDLEHLFEVEAVVHGGRLLTREAIDEGLEAIEARNAGK